MHGVPLGFESSLEDWSPIRVYFCIGIDCKKFGLRRFLSATPLCNYEVYRFAQRSKLGWQTSRVVAGSEYSYDTG